MDKAVKMRSSAQGGDNEEPSSGPQQGGDLPGTSRSSRSRHPEASETTRRSANLMDELLEESSVGRPSPVPSIDDEQKAMVQECLTTIEAGLINSGVHLNAERVLPYVEVITRRDGTIVEGEALLKTSGIYIVQEGALDMCAADGETVTQRLETGDFFGELSVLFRVPSNRGVQVVSSEVTLLLLPADVVRECASVETRAQGFSKEVMLNWCVKRSYLESSEIFGHRVLAHKVVLSCLKESVLSDLSLEAMQFIAELAIPMLFDPGDMIYNAGEDANYLFLILKGRVHILRGENIVETKAVGCSDEGCCLGHLEFFSGVKLNYSAKASSPVIVAMVSKEVLLEMFNTFHEELRALQVLLSKHKIQK